MASRDSSPPPPSITGSDNDELASSLKDIALSDEPNQSEEAPLSSTPTRPPRVYSRAELLFLHNSPLVKPPDGMPDRKDWFGAENEQNLSKRESDPSTPTRARGFRRDADDETHSRQLFRSGISQPSQMGNFKHPSSRTNDRDKDGEKDGSERLRNLSDKYDRDRLLPLRNKERDPLPHLAAGSSRSQNQLSPPIARRSENTRDAAKKKIEASDDWRRGSDPRKAIRDEGDRDERDLDSRGRDSSLSRRDKDSYRKDRDVYRKGDRDFDTDFELEDPRRWRDDGKRDERIATRRGDRARERDNERWTVVEERDSRNSKRASGRDRKAEDNRREKDDRRDADKEKEPAWMDAYVPPSSSSGILGAKSADGELDGIQAFKKGMKEKEQKDKDSEGPKILTNGSSENPLDEIQMFKMMMKREQGQPNKTSDQEISLPQSQPQVESSNENTILHSVMKDSKSSPGDSQPTLLSILTAGESLGSSLNPTGPLTDKEKAPSSRVFPNPIGQDSPVESPLSSFPPQGSRLLALGSRRGTTSTAPTQKVPAVGPIGTGVQGYPDGMLPQLELPPKESARSSPNFSPFEEQSRTSYITEDSRDFIAVDSARRVSGERTYSLELGGPDSGVMDAANGYLHGRASRFAKFFDGKPKEVVPQKVQSAMGSSFGNVPRRELNGPGGNPEARAMDDIFAMLNSSTQGQRNSSPLPPPNSAPSSSNMSFGHQAQVQLQHIQNQQHLQSLHAASRLEPLYESRLDSRNFVPDGLVPGLRSAPPPRRENNNNGMFGDPLDDPILYSNQRVPPPPMHQRGLDPLYNVGNGSPLYPQQTGRNGGVPMHGQYRGGPSPISGQPSLQNPQMQRLPPGLANLGGRPPIDQSQFLLHNSVPTNIHSSLQPQLSNYSPNGALGYGNGPQAQLRGNHVPQLNPLLQQQLGSLGHPNTIDLRAIAQAQAQQGQGLLGNSRTSFPPPPSNPQMHPAMTLRQQQQQHQQHQQHHQQQLHVVPQLVPSHVQQQGLPVTSNQAHDLMAILMGGHRE